jgi:hypothetical protein
MTGNRVYVQSVPRVRIPLSPPLTTNELLYAPDGIASKAQHLRSFLLFAKFGKAAKKLMYQLWLNIIQAVYICEYLWIISRHRQSPVSSLQGWPRCQHPSRRVRPSQLF